MYCRFGVLKISAAVLLISLKIYTNLLFFLATALQNQCKTLTKWCAIQKKIACDSVPFVTLETIHTFIINSQVTIQCFLRLQTLYPRFSA